MNDDSLARQLLRQAETIAELRREVERLAQESTDALADIIARLDIIETQPLDNAADRTVTSWCWRYAGPETAENLRRGLTDWVAWIRHRYPLAKRIPGCWPQHPEVIEELTALWLAWQAAYVEADAPSPPRRSGTTAGCPASSIASSTAPWLSTVARCTRIDPQLCTQRCRTDGLVAVAKRRGACASQSST